MKDNSKSNIDSDLEREAVQISLGQIEPTTEWQKRLKEEMDEIDKKGGIIEIPSN